MAILKKCRTEEFDQENRKHQKESFFGGQLESALSSDLGANKVLRKKD